LLQRLRFVQRRHGTGHHISLATGMFLRSQTLYRYWMILSATLENIGFRGIQYYPRAEGPRVILNTEKTNIFQCYSKDHSISVLFLFSTFCYILILIFDILQSSVTFLILRTLEHSILMKTSRRTKLCLTNKIAASSNHFSLAARAAVFLAWRRK
jgi:hypothetical protein